MPGSIDDDPWVGADSARQRRPVPKALWWVLGGCGGLVLLLALALGVFVVRAGLGPELHAVPGDQVDASTQAYLRERGVLDEGETIVYFYSSGLFDAESTATFCTDRKVVDYDVEDGEEWHAEILAYEEIEELEFHAADDGEVSLIVLQLREREPHTLFLPDAEGGDREFEAALRAEWERVRK
ncbi:MAG: hypothetical protein IPJ77_00010 [Planctomycetes bacterium]|nr:hypothetical protein [Planctomycetota bacterium]